MTVPNTLAYHDSATITDFAPKYSTWVEVTGSGKPSSLLPYGSKIFVPGVSKDSNSSRLMKCHDDLSHGAIVSMACG